MPNFGVNRIRKINGGGSCWKRCDIAFGSKDKHLILVKIDLEVCHELAGVGHLLLPTNNARQPSHVLCGALLIREVRSYPPFGAVMHLWRAYLHLDGLALWTNHCGVQRLIQVELGHSDVVLEPPRNGSPHGMD